MEREIRWTDPPQLPAERQKRSPSRWIFRNGPERTRLASVRGRSARSEDDNDGQFSHGIRHAVPRRLSFSFSYFPPRVRSSRAQHPPAARRSSPRARRGVAWRPPFLCTIYIAATSPARRRGLERGPSSFRTSPTMSGSCPNRRESEPLTDHKTRFFFPFERKQASFDG